MSAPSTPPPSEDDRARAERMFLMDEADLIAALADFRKEITAPLEAEIARLLGVMAILHGFGSIEEAAETLTALWALFPDYEGEDSLQTLIDHLLARLTRERDEARDLNKRVLDDFNYLESTYGQSLWTTGAGYTLRPLHLELLAADAARKERG